MIAIPLQTRQREFGAYLMAGFPKLDLPGLPLKSASALCGNATQENLCLPVTSGAKDHGSDGTMQWRLNRLTDMKTWCVAHFKEWDTLEAQAAYVLYEIKTLYPALGRDLTIGDKSLATLTANVCDLYEIPNPEYANMGYVPDVGSGKVGRINYAYDVQKLLVTDQLAHIAIAPAYKAAVSNTATKQVTGVAGVTVVASTAAQAFTHSAWVSVTLAVLGVGAMIYIYFRAKQKVAALVQKPVVVIPSSAPPVISPVPPSVKP